MVNPFINSVTSWFLKKRIHQIELFLKYPNEVQNELLLKLLNSARKVIKITQKEFLFLPMKIYQK